MLISFELSMPSKGSWNGRWSGENRPCVQIRAIPKDKAERVLSKKEYDYRWDDGWCARVSVKRVLAREADKLRKISVGFYGYDWMIDSIIRTGQIQIEKDGE